MSENELIVYQFSRMKVEQGDFTHFLSLYTPDKLPAGPGLKAMLGRMLFCIEGYDADPREIYLIPEVRRARGACCKNAWQRRLGGIAWAAAAFTFLIVMPVALVYA